MKIWDKLKKADAGVSKKYDYLSRSFTFRVITKLVGEIVLACFVALAVYVATVLYNDISAVSKENKNLDNIYISASDKYVESLFGLPVVSEEDKNQFVNKFFLLDDAVLRTVSKDDTVIAYFITSKKLSRKIAVSSQDNETVKLGEITFAKNRDYNLIHKTDCDFCGQPRVCYYAEKFMTGRSRMYNTYVFGTVYYGFKDQNALDLLQTAYLKSESESADNELAVEVNIDDNDIMKLREKAKPNTYGVIANNYDEMISIIPQDDFLSGSWLDVYYLIKD